MICEHESPATTLAEVRNVIELARCYSVVPFPVVHRGCGYQLTV